MPLVGGAIAVAYNVEGLDNLVLNSDTVAGIFASSITKWNDPAIVATNPNATLPDATIAQFHRSDSSGTTDNFTSYLTATAPSTWTFGSGKDWTATGGQGSKGSDQVIASVNQTPNSIGYVELSYVLDAAGAKAASIDNGGGPVEATSENAAKTIAAAQVTGTGDDLTVQIDYTTKEPGAYEFTCQSGLASDKNPALVQAFLNYGASDAGQANLVATGYVPITGDLLAKVRASIASIQTS
jgi:phosphate transport system substrate-binding protein